MVVEERVLASIEVAETRAHRRRGLLGREGVEGALLIRRARWIHTLGMKFSIDVAYCDCDLSVIEIVTMPPHRIGRPRLKARHVLEAESGNLRRWGLAGGDQVEIRE